MAPNYYQIVFIISIHLLFVSFSFAGQSYPPKKRNTLINNTLNCVENYKISNDSVNWEDVCYTFDRRRYSEQRRQVINETLDVFEHSQEETKRPRKPKKSKASPQIKKPVLKPNQHPVFAAEKGLELEEDSSWERSKAPYSPWQEYLFPKSRFEFGVTNLYHEYKEPGIMKQYGYFYGPQASYTHRISQNKKISSLRDLFKENNKVNVFKVDGTLQYGTVDFKSDEVPDANDKKNYMLEVRATAGYDFILDDTTAITPYAGMGWRYNLDKSPGRNLPLTFKFFDYKRESRYLYLPFGVDAVKKLKDDWSLEASFEFDHLIQGWLKNHFGDGGLSVINTGGEFFSLDTQDFEQDTGYGLRGSLKLVKDSDKLQFFVEPFFRYWKIKESETLQFTSSSGRIVWIVAATGAPITHSEPKNVTTEIGIKFGLHY